MKMKINTMIYDQDLREKIDILVQLLLLFSIIVFNIMKILVKTFIIKPFVRINEIHKKRAIFLCHFFYLKYDIRYFSFEKAVYICHDYLVCSFFTLKHFEDFFAQMSPRLSVFWNASLKQTLHFHR